MASLKLGILAGSTIAVAALVGATIYSVRVHPRHDSEACQRNLDAGRLAITQDRISPAGAAAELSARTCKGRENEVEALRERIAKRQAEMADGAEREEKARRARDLEHERDRLANLSVAAAAREGRALMSDTTDELSPGMAGFATWASAHMKWSSLMAAESTAYGKFMKDSNAERGKRVCLSGEIVQIARAGDVFDGIVYSFWQSQTVRFLAVGDTGELVQGSKARFCGIAIGAYSYKNSGGGVTHGIQAVGMFDLNANRKR